jgi:hypothetical protein
MSLGLICYSHYSILVKVSCGEVIDQMIIGTPDFAEDFVGMSISELLDLWCIAWFTPSDLDDLDTIIANVERDTND